VPRLRACLPKPGRVVVIFGTDANAAEQLIANLPGAGQRASRTPAQDTAAIASRAAEIGAMECRLHILVNNAGSTGSSRMPLQASTSCRVS
jgi:hypothetical protein